MDIKCVKKRLSYIFHDLIPGVVTLENLFDRMKNKILVGPMNS